MNSLWPEPVLYWPLPLPSTSKSPDTQKILMLNKHQLNECTMQCNPDLHFFREFLNDLHIYNNKVPKCGWFFSHVNVRTWFGSSQLFENSPAFQCKTHSGRSPSLTCGTSGYCRRGLPRGVELWTAPSTHCPQREEGAINLKDLKENSRMANHEKKWHSPGTERGHWWWSAEWPEGREVDNWRQGSHRDHAGALQWGQDLNLSPVPHRQQYDFRQLSQPCTLLSHSFYTYKTRTSHKGCLCNWCLLSAYCVPERNVNEVMNGHIWITKYWAWCLM